MKNCEVFRTEIENQEHNFLADWATFASKTRGRKKEEEKSNLRTDFMRDRDRIVHSSAFRRLKRKAQVFLLSANDLIRTRLTHTLEVSQISRTIAKILRLNEDLTEAIALGHDLGHAPFGHIGERVLNKLFKRGFRHNLQSLRIVDFLEKHGEGLNLTYEVRDGILKHSKWGKKLFDTQHSSFLNPITPEGRIVQICDRVAYINHDLDDALRCDILTKEEIPSFIYKELGESHSERINRIVSDIIEQSRQKKAICMSEFMQTAIEKTRNFLYEKVYFHKAIQKEAEKAAKMISDLYDFFTHNPKILLEETKDIAYPKGTSLERRAVDYIAMMTDDYALYQYKKHLLPKKWFLFEA